MEQACPALINSSGREADHGGEASGREGGGGRRNRGRRGWPLHGGGRRKEEGKREGGGGRKEWVAFSRMRQICLLRLHSKYSRLGA